MEHSKIRQFLGKYWILLAFVALKLILQFVLVNPIYELHRDEFLHLDQAAHPAFGYVSVPPFTSWMASFIYFMGGGLFWIRFVPAFFGALTIVFAWLIVEALDGKLAAKVLVASTLVFSVYARMNVLFQPNSFDILAWTMVFYFMVQYFKTNQQKWLFALSLIIALGLYNKYTIAFLLVGLMIGLLLTPQRGILGKKAIFYAVGLVLLLFLPNIIWQISNNYPLLHHMAALNGSQLVNVSRIDFLIDQVKYGVVGIPSLAALLALMFYTPFKPYRFIVWSFIAVMVMFTMARAKSYYPLGIYPALFAFGSVFLEDVLKKWKVFVMASLAFFSVAAFFLIVRQLMPYHAPNAIVDEKESYEKLGLLRWEDGINHHLPQDFADMLGWREMAEKSLLAYESIPKEELLNTLVYCDNYGQCGALNFYNRSKMPQANSFSTDYIFWIPKQERIKNILLVGHLPNQEIVDMFKVVRLVGEVENEFAREKETKIFLLMDADPSFTEWFNHTVEERKRNFEIF
ncbi:MAG: glycosyltransferase family 39 protein [Breznakibacter sp.]|nr:glycosyltransferase family 39 protein [Breznakibacter sp.]